MASLPLKIRQGKSIQFFWGLYYFRVHLSSPWQWQSLHDRLWRRDVCRPGDAKSFEPARWGRQGREVRGGKPWGEKAANKIFLIPQSPWKGCCDLTFPVGLLWPLYHCQPTQCPWQGSTNNNPTTANVITSHSPFPAEPGTQSFNPTGGKGTFLTQCEYNQNMSQYF